VALAERAADHRGSPLIPARILGTGSLIPGRQVSTAEVVERSGIGKSAAEIIEKTGIHTRSWCEPGTLAAPIAAEVMRRALDAAGLRPRDLRRLIFVSSSGGDRLTPATANAVCFALGIEGSCDCFDLNNACLGFLTSFDLAVRSVATGLGPVGIAVVELPSQFISPENPRPFLVFGDAAAAVVIGEGRPGEGVLGVSLGNNGAHGNAVIVPHPRLSGRHELAQFLASNKEMNQLSEDQIATNVREALAQGNTTIDEVAAVLVHQPNGPMMDMLVRTIGADPKKTTRVVQEIGSSAAAAIPVSLDRLMRRGSVQPGDKLLFVGVGAGVSYGALLFQVAPA
jgi:3-oxoacyl-[acyl-carrier-protein] synthase-3